MSLGLYFAFVVASVALMLIPGPNVALIVANSLARGVGAGLATVAGTTAAMAVQVIAVELGLSALPASLLPALRWAGVAYLCGMAWREFYAPDSRGAARSGFFVGLTNPKTLIFLAAFFPQFIDPQSPQWGLLGVTFLATALIVDSGWALLAARVAGAVKLEARLRHRLTGVILLLAGLGLALTRL